MPGFVDDIEFEFGEYATRDLLYRLVNRALDVPLMIRTTGGTIFEYIIADGVIENLLMTWRTEFWNNQPVYFDGENFVIPE